MRVPVSRDIQVLSLLSLTKLVGRQDLLVVISANEGPGCLADAFCGGGVLVGEAGEVVCGEAPCHRFADLPDELGGVDPDHPTADQAQARGIAEQPDLAVGLTEDLCS